MIAQLPLFAPTPAAPPPPAAPAQLPAKTPWRLTLTVSITGAALLTTSAPADVPALLRLADKLGLKTRELAVCLPVAASTPLGDVGGDFLAYLARECPDRELQVFRQRETLPATPSPARPDWPVTVTVYADGGAVIGVPDRQRVLFLALAHQHGFTTDGNVVVTRAVDPDTGGAPESRYSVQLADAAQAFLDALPYTALDWDFAPGSLPDCYGPLPHWQGEPDAVPPIQAGDVIAAPDSLWDGATVIHTYTRAQALEDGFLVDVTGTAREAGFIWPVAVTRAVWTLIEEIPASQRHQSVAGRLWDVLWMASRAVKSAGNTDTVSYRLIMHHGRRIYVTLKACVSGGDDGEPVITIMTPDED